MKMLLHDDLQKIDRAIDEYTKTLAAFQYPIGLIVTYLFRHYETYVMKLIDANKAEDRKRSIATNLLDELHVGIYLAYRFGKSENCNISLKINNDVDIAVNTLLDYSLQYSKVFDILSYLFRGMAVAFYDTDGNINVKLKEHTNSDDDITSLLLCAPDSPATKIKSGSIMPNFDTRIIYEHAYLKKSSSGKLIVSISDQNFEKILNIRTNHYSGYWQFDPRWQFGEYSMADFRQFWLVLNTICLIRHYLFKAHLKKGGTLESLIDIREKKYWLNEISRYSRLSKKLVNDILSDLIYTPESTIGVRRQIPAIYQPFFEVNKNLIAVSNWLVLHSNIERNILDLKSHLNEFTFSDLTTKKEKQWLLKLEPRLKSYNLVTYGPFDIKYSGQKSNVDLLVVDHTDCFGIAFELKWLKDPDAVREIFYTDQELNRGIDQAELVKKWLDQKSIELRQMLGITQANFQSYIFESAVLSKNTIGSGLTKKTR
jgi:hypothetical protein